MQCRSGGTATLEGDEDVGDKILPLNFDKDLIDVVFLADGARVLQVFRVEHHRFDVDMVHVILTSGVKLVKTDQTQICR